MDRHYGTNMYLQFNANIVFPCCIWPGPVRQNVIGPTLVSARCSINVLWISNIVWLPGITSHTAQSVLRYFKQIILRLKTFAGLLNWKIRLQLSVYNCTEALDTFMTPIARGLPGCPMFRPFTAVATKSTKTLSLGRSSRY